MQLIPNLCTYRQLVYACECWSGDLDKPSKYHHYIATIGMVKQAYIDDLKKAEGRIEELEAIVNG